jgi:hypothetical protein
LEGLLKVVLQCQRRRKADKQRDTEAVYGRLAAELIDKKKMLLLQEIEQMMLVLLVCQPLKGHQDAQQLDPDSHQQRIEEGTIMVPYPSIVGKVTV